MKKLNLGCGTQCPPGWINIDSSMGVRIAQYPILKSFLHFLVPKSWNILPNEKWAANTVWMNITKKFFYEDNSVDYIYSSHTFEHLTYDEARFTLSECYRVMKPGGIIRIIVPDFERLVNSYIENKKIMPKEASYKFHKDSGYFEIPVPGSMMGLLKFYFRRKNNHYFLYDDESLRKQLEDVGFVQITRKEFGESEMKDILQIDIESRFKGSICLEAFKK